MNQYEQDALRHLGRIRLKRILINFHATVKTLCSELSPVLSKKHSKGTSVKRLAKRINANSKLIMFLLYDNPPRTTP